MQGFILLNISDRTVFRIISLGDCVVFFYSMIVILINGIIPKVFGILLAKVLLHIPRYVFSFKTPINGRSTMDLSFCSKRVNLNLPITSWWKFQFC